MSSQPDPHYFKAAREWYFERYAASQVQANRWFVTTLCLSILLTLSLVALACLLPLKTLVPLIVHHNSTTHEVWITKPKTPYVPETDAETQSDLVRYLVNRESYSSSDINQRFSLVTLLSDNAIAKRYADEQSNSEPKAPINVLGEKGSRTVRVEDIVFIDKENKHNKKSLKKFKSPSRNLAKVDFVTTTLLPNGSNQTDYWVATLGWEYHGLPKTQQDAWENWNGFTVTQYRLDPRNVTHDSSHAPSAIKEEK